MPAPVVATVPGAFSLGAACGAGLLFLLRRLGRCSFGRHARWVESPHPTWKPGQPQPPPYGQNAPMIALDPAKVDKLSMYAFFMSAVVVRRGDCSDTQLSFGRSHDSGALRSATGTRQLSRGPHVV
jgi:hypothetical protein